MKKLFIIGLSAIIISLGAVQNISALKFDPETHEYNEKPKILEDEVERIKLIAEQEEIIMFRQRAGGSKYLNIPYERQNTRYTCGPASVRMVSLYLGYSWNSVGSTSTSTLTYIDPWAGRIGHSRTPRTVTEEQFTRAMTIYGRQGYYARR